MSFKNKFCAKPFEYLEIEALVDGKIPCYICCPQLVPDVVGDFLTQDVDQIWNSEKLQKIRQSIHDESFEYCKQEDCPEIQSDSLQDKRLLEGRLWDIAVNKKVILDGGPKTLNLNYDRTCNLACPSCRTDFISINTDVKERKAIEEIEKKMKDQCMEEAEEFIVCSSGDPFASKHFFSFLKTADFSKNPKNKIQIVTNGVLFTEDKWNELSNIHGKVGMVCVSLDASREVTYKVVRKGGHWSSLMKNLEFIGSLLKKGEIEKFRMDFVVQDLNYREMPEFVDLGARFGADEVFFQKIVSWDTYTEEEMKQRMIYEPSHPDFDDFLRVVADPRLKEKIVNPGNLGSFLEKKYNPIKKFKIKNAIFHTIKKRFREVLLRTPRPWRD